MQATKWTSGALTAAALAVTALAVTALVAPPRAPEAHAQLGSAGPVPVPSQDPFYSYDGAAPLDSLAAGTPLKQRGVPVHIGGAATPLMSTQILYRTEDSIGRPTATVTSVVKPPNPNGKVISFQSAYDSLTPDCQPSYALSGGFDRGIISTIEIASVIQLYQAQGYTIVLSDFEGQDPHFAAGLAYAHGTLDGIRAASRVPATGVGSDSPVALVGYSGGAIATQWASELAPTYAPEINSRLVGAASGGLLVAPLNNLEYVDGSPMWKGVIPMAIMGIARSFGEDMTPYLTDYGKSVMAEATDTCIVPMFVSMLTQHQGKTWDDMVKPEFRDPKSIEPLQRLGKKMQMGTHGTPTVPMMIRQGGAGWMEGTPNTNPFAPGDGVMILNDARDLARKYCHTGLPIDYQEYPHFGHVLGAVSTFVEAFDWINKRFAGAPVNSTCGMLESGGPYAGYAHP